MYRSKGLFRNITVLAVVALFTMLGTSCTIPAGILSAPAINVFDASPMSISTGGTATLNWSVTGATTVDIEPGIGKVALTGTRLVLPTATTAYTLTATNTIGSSIATTQVMVTGVPVPPTTTPPPQNIPIINQFTAVPETVYPGASSVLNWNVSNATSVIINSIGTVPSSGKVAVCTM